MKNFVAQLGVRFVPTIAAKKFMARIPAQSRQTEFFWQCNFRDRYDVSEILVDSDIKHFRVINILTRIEFKNIH